MNPDYMVETFYLLGHIRRKSLLNHDNIPVPDLKDTTDAQIRKKLHDLFLQHNKNPH